MKFILNPKLKKEVVIGIEDSSDEEDNKSNKVEEMLFRVLEKIDEGLKKFLELLEGRHRVKGNVVMEDVEDEAKPYPIDFENK